MCFSERKRFLFAQYFIKIKLDGRNAVICDEIRDRTEIFIIKIRCEQEEIRDTHRIILSADLQHREDAWYQEIPIRDKDNCSFMSQNRIPSRYNAVRFSFEDAILFHNCLVNIFLGIVLSIALQDNGKIISQ